MERNAKTPLLFLLLALLHVNAARKEDCPTPPDKNLSCYTDYNHTINCVWDSSYVSDHAGDVCTIHAKKDKGDTYSESCNLEPVSVSRPMLKKCTLNFKRPWNFVYNTELSLLLSCKPMKRSLNVPYKPYCHIKLNPPPKPVINSANVSWFPQVTKHRFTNYNYQLQWKQKDQSWSDPDKEGVEQCKWDCTEQLDEKYLIQGERYEARVRVQPMGVPKPTWSDWSPTASWESSIGKPKPTLDKVVAGVVFGIIPCAAVLVAVLIRANKTTWIYIVKKIRGPPLPNPQKSFLQDVNFQNWLSPYFTGKSFHSLLDLEIHSVEITSAVDIVAPCTPEAAVQDNMRSERKHESAGSNLPKIIYSQLCHPPVSSLTAGSLEPCTSDSPYGPVGTQGEGKNAEQTSEVRGKEVEIRQLLSNGSHNSEPMAVISDYEKVEKLQLERSRFQSLDSGVCSGEEVSQESLEADSISVTDSHNEGLEGKGGREGGTGEEGHFQKLFGGGGGIFGQGSIPVSSDYERVQMLQADCPELPSLDSGISSGGEEQVSQEESLEDLDKSTESTSLLFLPPSPPAGALPCSLPSFTSLGLNISGPGLRPGLLPLPSHVLEKTALLSTNTLVEPSGDGYVPVRQT